MSLFCSLDNLDQTPALIARKRSTFHNTHDIADLGVVIFVVRLEARRLANDLAVCRVGNANLRDDDDRLVHLIRGNAPLLHAPMVIVAFGYVMLLHAAPRPSASRK